MSDDEKIRTLALGQLQQHLDRVCADREAIAAVSQDADAVIVKSRANLETMLPHLGYLDNPDHPMAVSLFSCAALLALYLALKDEGMDVHAFGAVVLQQTALAPPQGASASIPRRLQAAAIASGEVAASGEFEFETLGEGEDFEWGMNIKSCAICSLFSRFDAMDLVPYMCASDDVVSDIAGQGLKRTGTIALGAKQCDFRFKKGGEGQALAKQYPDKIRLLPS